MAWLVTLRYLPLLDKDMNELGSHNWKRQFNKMQSRILSNMASDIGLYETKLF